MNVLAGIGLKQPPNKDDERQVNEAASSPMVPPQRRYFCADGVVVTLPSTARRRTD